MTYMSTLKYIDVFKKLVAERVGEEVKPYSYQLKMYAVYEDLLNGNKNVAFLIAPCGGGKTEAVVLPYLTQFALSRVMVPRMIYATPTQTLVYNMKKRFDSYIDALVKVYPRLANIRGKLELNVEHGLDVDPHYLVPRFTIATYDVVAYAWLARRTIPWRPFTTRGALLSSIVVFDEAHLLQDIYSYSQRVFPKLVATMAKAGVPVVVMSATLPDQIVNEVKQELGEDAVEVVKPSEVSLNIGNITTDTEYIEKSAEIDLTEAIKMIKERVISAVDSGKDALVVLNTVYAAFEVFNCLRGALKERYGEQVVVVDEAEEAKKQIDQGKRVLLCFVHGRLPMGVRRRREKIFEDLKSLKKKSLHENTPKNWNLVVVATQVAEVGVDYSFDVVISEAALPTALIQRAMRGGRIKSQQAEFVILPPIAVLSESGERVPAYSVYSKALVEYGEEWARLEKPSTGKLVDVDFLVRTASEEYTKMVEERGKDKTWAVELADKARNILEASNYLPPLATNVHRAVLERFKLRLGEYVVLHVPIVKLSAERVDELGKALADYLSSISHEEILDSSIRLNISIYKSEKEEEDKKVEYIVKIPAECVWSLKDGIVVPVAHTLKTARQGLEGVRILRLMRRDDKLYAPSMHYIGELFGRFVVVNPSQLDYFDPSVGLVKVSWIEVRVSKP